MFESTTQYDLPVTSESGLGAENVRVTPPKGSAELSSTASWAPGSPELLFSWIATCTPWASLSSPDSCSVTLSSTYPAVFGPAVNRWAIRCSPSSILPPDVVIEYVGDLTDPVLSRPSAIFETSTISCAWAVAGKASAPTSTSSAAAASARAEWTRPRRALAKRAKPAGRAAADAVDGEGWPPRRDGNRSGGDGGRCCSRARGAVMASGARRSALGARRSALGARRDYNVINVDNVQHTHTMSSSSTSLPGPVSMQPAHSTRHCWHAVYHAV